MRQRLDEHRGPFVGRESADKEQQPRLRIKSGLRAQSRRGNPRGQPFAIDRITEKLSAIARKARSVEQFLHCETAMRERRVGEPAQFARFCPTYERIAVARAA